MLNRLSKNHVKSFNLALITGASSGIGMALCHLLAAQKIPLLIAGRDVMRLNALANELKGFVPISVIPGDLSQKEDRQKLVNIIYEETPDLIINNAGVGLYGKALSYSTHEQLNLLEVNAKALMEITLEGARALLTKSAPGVILNVSSASDSLVFPHLAVYAATKAFVSNFSQALDYELSPANIRVLVSCPGMVRTAFRQRASQSENTIESSLSMDVNYAAARIWKQIKQKRRKNVFDWKTVLGIFFSKFLPQTWLASILAKSIESFYPSRPFVLRNKQ